MKELSLNILDIAQNSLKAEASLIGIEILETEQSLTLTVSDDGYGMKPEFLARVTDPFSTTRTTRKVGLGLPFLKMEAEMTGGGLEICSKHRDDFPDSHGTTVVASFRKDHIDFIPLGNIIDTLCTLIMGAGGVDITFVHRMPDLEVALSTAEMRELLGEVPLDSAEVIAWVREYLTEAYSAQN